VLRSSSTRMLPRANARVQLQRVLYPSSGSRLAQYLTRERNLMPSAADGCNA